MLLSKGFIYVKDIPSPHINKGDILGNIRQTFIKTIAKDLMDQFPDHFIADNFQHNKHKVQEMTTVDSNLLRNRIAGYITRKLASKKKESNEPISE